MVIKYINNVGKYLKVVKLIKNKYGNIKLFLY